MPSWGTIVVRYLALVPAFVGFFGLFLCGILLIVIGSTT